jgi:hypothetical protein
MGAGVEELLQVTSIRGSPMFTDPKARPRPCGRRPHHRRNHVDIPIGHAEEVAGDDEVSDVDFIALRGVQR